MLFIYGFSLLPLGLFNLVSVNLYGFAEKYIAEGHLDRVLLRPVNPLAQVIFESFNVSGLNEIILGIGIMAYAGLGCTSPGRPADVLAVLLLAPAAALVYVGVFLGLTCVSFWSEDRLGLAPPVYNVIRFSRYPLTIYSRWVQIFLMFVLPFAWVAFYPATWFVGAPEFRRLALLTPAGGAAGLRAGLLRSGPGACDVTAAPAVEPRKGTSWSRSDFLHGRRVPRRWRRRPSASTWCGENGVVRLSFAQGDDLQIGDDGGARRGRRHAGRRLGLPRRGGADGARRRGVPGASAASRLKLVIEGAAGTVVKQEFPFPRTQHRPEPGYCIVGIDPSARLVDGRTQLVHWQVMFPQPPQKVDLPARPRFVAQLQDGRGLPRQRRRSRSTRAPSTPTRSSDMFGAGCVPGLPELAAGARGDGPARHVVLAGRGGLHAEGRRG